MKGCGFSQVNSPRIVRGKDMISDPVSLEFLKWLWGLLMVPLWFLFKKSGEASKDLSEHKLYAANTYVKHTSLQETEARILSAIGGLKEEIKNKADK